jgi:hypothetical protein
VMPRSRQELKSWQAISRKTNIPRKAGRL